MQPSLVSFVDGKFTEEGKAACAFLFIVSNTEIWGGVFAHCFPFALTSVFRGCSRRQQKQKWQMTASVPILTSFLAYLEEEVPGTLWALTGLSTALNHPD